MSRLTWNIFTEGSGDLWDADGTIYRPNENLEIDITSTQVKKRLADGSNAFVNPETKSIKEPIEFIWLELTGTDYNNLRAKIKAYVDAGTKVKITDHNSVDYIGRFLNIKRVWISGVEDTEDLQSIFERTE